MDNNEKIRDALIYAEISNGIEGHNYLTPEEFEQLKEDIINKRKDTSFLYGILEALGEKRNGKKR